MLSRLGTVGASIHLPSPLQKVSTLIFEYTMLDKTKYLSEHLASPNEAALSHSSKFDGFRLSPHFALGELTKTS